MIIKNKKFLSIVTAVLMMSSGAVAFAAEGNSVSSVSTVNDVNGSNVSVSSQSSFDIGNRDTGENSENSVSFEGTNTFHKDVNSFADVENDVDVNANSGQNKINKSGSGDVSLTTGNASAKANVSNEVNTDHEVINVSAQAEEEQGEQGEQGQEVSAAEGGLGAGPSEAAAVSAAEGGLGAGPLAEAGANGLIIPLIMAALATGLSWIKQRKALPLKTM